MSERDQTIDFTGWPEVTDRLRMLVMDDEPDIGEFIRDVAIDVGFDAVAIHQASKFEKVYSSGFEVIVLDLVMPDIDGVELLRFLAGQHASAKIILISGYDKGVLNSAQKLALEHGLDIIATFGKPLIHEELETLFGSITSSPEYLRDSTIELLELPTKEELKTAIGEGELEPWFQPQLGIQSGSLVGVEALIRWNHPQRGLLMPNIIIPLAEQTKMMDELTSFVFEQSFKWIRAWREQGLETRTSINVTVESLKELGFPERVSEKARQYQLSPKQVVVEVTESGLMLDLTKSLDVLTRTRMKGIELSIDDFGTGYSSMVQLYRAPFSEIKVDRSFVMQATSDAEALAIVEMTILLGHKLGMTVVAEGIENKETWHLLADLGCDTAQGFLISKPMPGNKLVEWAKNYHD